TTAVDLEPARSSRDDVEARIAVRFDTEAPRRAHVRPAVDRRAYADGIEEIADDVGRSGGADRLHQGIGTGPSSYAEMLCAARCADHGGKGGLESCRSHA